MQSRPQRRRRRFSVCRLAAAGLLASALCAPAVAEPGNDVDPVLKLLVEKGVVGRAETPAVSSAAAAGRLAALHERASGLVVAAMNFIGLRYQRGGTSADSGFDCSGFVRHVYDLSLGLVLPRRVDDQAQARGLVAVERDDLQPGDLVFFNTLRRTFSHVGIYIGEQRFIHSPRPGKDVRIEDMRLAYWAQRFTGARRVEASALPSAPVAPFGPATPAAPAAPAPPLAPATSSEAE